jgi:hypothetical protein
MSRKGKRKARELAEKAARASQSRERNFTKLGGHERKGSTLSTPLMTIPGGLQLASWLDDRVPEMVWGALLIERLGRRNALTAFRILAHHVHEARDGAAAADATLSGLSRLRQDLFQRMTNELCGPKRVREVLRPLLLFPDLPARERWAEAISMEPQPEEDWNYLGRAVALVTDHQSQEATDLRWARVIVVAATGRVHLPVGLAGVGDELTNYPDVGDMRAVRPTIRAFEGALDGISAADDSAKSDWPKKFWDFCMTSTVCHPAPLPLRRSDGAPVVGAALNNVRRTASALAAHQATTRRTTAVDARHEAAFGLTSYCVATLGELLRIENGTGILGRAGLRTILEAVLTLAYLAAKDDEGVWRTYRSYGAGQAKLAFLKLDDLTEVSADELPSSIDAKLLEALANEDRWQEFVEINLGHWDSSNLRKTSEAAGEKGLYDKFYGWTSAFVHGNWIAVRATQFDLCANPLHRWHRVLRDSTLSLGDVVPDAAVLVNRALDLLDRLYPGFSVRVGASGESISPPREGIG